MDYVLIFCIGYAIGKLSNIATNNKKTKIVKEKKPVYIVIKPPKEKKKEGE